jgi:hypothetical protein
MCCPTAASQRDSGRTDAHSLPVLEMRGECSVMMIEKKKLGNQPSTNVTSSSWYRDVTYELPVPKSQTGDAGYHSIVMLRNTF